MDVIKVRKDYAAHNEYRLLSIDREWLTSELKHITFESDARETENRPAREDGERVSARRKRNRVCLVLHGSEQLHVHSRQSTDLVRRVEYSNTLLVASRATVERSAKQQTDRACTNPDEAAQPVPHRVVRAALSRVFETQKGVPQLNVLALLGLSYVTIEELENGTTEEKRAPGAQQYTFGALARTVTCSPAELAAALKSAGAIVLHNKVRLLHPSLLHEALRTVLIFLDGTPNVDVSWSDVEAHFCPTVYPVIVLHVVKAVYGNDTHGDQQAAADAPLVKSGKALVGLAGHVFETHVETTRHVVTSRTGAAVDVLTMPFDAFYRSWKDGSPAFLFHTALVENGYSASLDHVRPDDLLPLLFGYVICERPNPDSYVGASVHWLPRDVLTTAVAERVDLLFSVKSQKWTASELKAYIEPLLVDAQSFAHTVARCAREYRLPGQPVTYTALSG